jgi:UDPglucose 6-dehydrogenase
MGSDSRIGQRFLFPGVGYGGSCFPKDVKALAKTAEDSRYNFSILKSVIHVNSKQRLKVANKLFSFFDGNLKGKKIGIWGLAFKPNTDDIREAPALYTIEKLIEAGAQVTVYDPEAMDNVKEIFGDRITYCSDPYGAAFNADALAIMTEWNVFRTPNFNTLWHSMSNPVIIDGRNLYEPEEMKNLGFYYDSIGRNICQSEEILEDANKEVKLV